MQAYCNVATEPLRKVAATTGKAYWEFRAAESVKGDREATWYTVRLFRDEDPGLNKGDFVCVTGKLKNDVFIARDGKPMGILTLLAFALTRISKDGRREELVRATESCAAKAADTPAPAAAQAQPAQRALADDEADNPWLQLV